MPDISIEVSAILLGVYLVASAAMQVIIGFSMGEGTRGEGVSFLFRGMAAMVYGISDSDAIGSGWTAFAGVMLMALPSTSIVTLATVVGNCLVVLGVVEIISSYEIYLSEKEFSDSNARHH
jgi:uncharacterized membrane protein HdeD (DUF308 family)